MKTQAKPSRSRRGVAKKPGWGQGPFLHLEIRKELKASAAREGVSMEERLHRILCEALGREDLMLRPAKAASA